MNTTLKASALALGLTLCCPSLWAQEQPPAPPNTDAQQNAVFNRPFIVGAQRAALGGYAEANLNYIGQEGINPGPSFEFRRFNLFVYSAIGAHLRFLSELEFEHGTAEITLETAQLDLELIPELILRAGVILPPLGAFNQAHDGPIWDFIERPLVSTTIIPSTFSEVGAGIHGSFLLPVIDLDYQLYLTQGLSDGILDNPEGRTSIPDGRTPELFAQDNNGQPAITGRVAVRYTDLLQAGLSAWHGAYNTFERDALTVDQRRTLTLTALDLELNTRWLQLRGEAAMALIELPSSLRTIFGERQWGAHLDLVWPLWRPTLFDLKDSSLNLGARLDYVDYHAGTLTNKEDAGLETTRLTASLCLRPGTETALKLNYSYQWDTDLLGNAPVRSARIQLGLATYF